MLIASFYKPDFRKVIIFFLMQESTKLCKLIFFYLSLN